MGDEERERPSLEPPKLFGRKKSKDRANPQDTTPAPPPPVEQPAVEETVEDTAVEEPAFEDVGVDPTEDPTPPDVAVETTVIAEPVGRSSADSGDTVVLEAATPAVAVDDAPSKPAKPGKPPRPPRTGQLLPGRPASALIGLVVGGVLVGLTLLGLQGCEAVRGTSSCGTAPGMGALIVIFAICVAVGRFLLKAVHVPDPGATSFLAVGLTCVVALLFVDLLDSWVAVVVIIPLTALTFLMSWWVTTTYVDTNAG